MLKSLHLHRRFFAALGAIAALFALSFAWAPLYYFTWILAAILAALVIRDAILLYRVKTPVRSRRHTGKLFSLGDKNTIRLTIQNLTPFAFSIYVIDELPPQLQYRHFGFDAVLPPEGLTTHQYDITPLSRGKYKFGHINVLLSTKLRLLRRLVRTGETMTIPTYPSVKQMKELELKTLSALAVNPGIKKIRRIGHHYEFEQIKQYEQGDDVRSINWKASSRYHRLMVNQYQEERSQNIYCILDKSRVMHMPFDGLTLTDYAINAILALSNIIIKRHDKPGFISFSDKLGAIVPASDRKHQMQIILDTLYADRPRPVEADYELLHYVSRSLINQRSLFLLFTNFESGFALERVLPILRKINKYHLLVVVIFRNTEIERFARSRPQTFRDIYHQTIAEKFIIEKRKMITRLARLGIQTIYTRPADLSISTINKYLELKAHGRI